MMRRVGGYLANRSRRNAAQAPPQPQPQTYTPAEPPQENDLPSA